MCYIGTDTLQARAIGLNVLAIVVALKRIAYTTPGALIAVTGAIVASWFIDLPSLDVSTVGWSRLGLEARLTRRAFDLEPCVVSTSTGVLNLHGDSGPR